ncbi:hypothetical protein PFISCL1PPCAC_15764, partial [Pristionchus fissidentatus]
VYLNMLQVNLNQKNVVESRLRDEVRTDKHTVFTAPEVTLEGDCEVVYTVVPESEDRKDKSSLRVTKSINF